MASRHLTVRERVIVHLSEYIRFSEEFECPAEMSQAGIALAIGKSRAHTTLELNRMKDAGLVTERLAHVRGTRSKRKTYTPTPQALDRERQIAARIEGMDIELSGTGSVNGERASRIIMTELPVSRAMAFDLVLSSNGKIDLKELEPQRESHTMLVETDSGSMDPLYISPGSQTFDAFLARAKALSKKGRPKEALATLGKALKTDPSDSDLSRVYYSRACILRKQGNYPSALEEINASLKIAREFGETLWVGRCQMEKAMILSSAGNETQSLELLDSADEIFRRKDSQVDLLRCGINQGIVLKNLGKFNEAIDVLEISLDLAERTGLDQLEAYAVVNLTDLLNEQREYERSKELARKARDIFRVLDEPIMLAASLYNLGEALAGLGEKEEAMASLDSAIAVLEKTGMLASRTDWLERYATILGEWGEGEKAKAMLRKI